MPPTRSTGKRNRGKRQHVCVRILAPCGASSFGASVTLSATRLRPSAAHSGGHPALASLYFAAYPPGVACATLADAEEDIRGTFAGDYGDLWPDASGLIEHRPPLSTDTPTPAAAILTVRRAPWEGTPECPFVIELFTAKAHRRLGLARLAFTHACNATLKSGASAIALRVSANNIEAISLYRSFGLTRWPSPP